MKNYPNSACFEKFFKRVEAASARGKSSSSPRRRRLRGVAFVLARAETCASSTPQSELEPRGLAIRDNELITKFSVLQGRSDAVRLGTHWLVVGEDRRGRRRGRDTHTSELPSTPPRRTLSIQLEPALARRPLQGCVCVGHRASVSLHIGRTLGVEDERL